MKEIDSHAAASPSAVTRDDSESGITLIEMMMGTAIMVIAMVSIIAASVSHANTRRVAAEVGQAFAACRDTIEEVRSMPIEEIVKLDGSGFEAPGRNGSTQGLRPIPGDSDGLPGEIIVQQEKQQGDEVLYRVFARVRWRGVSGRRAFELQTLIGNRQ